MRRPIGRPLRHRQPNRRRLGARRHRGLAAPILPDHADTGWTLVGDPCPRPPHRVRIDVEPQGDLLIRNAVTRQQQRFFGSPAVSVREVS
jgi:hypothetical protein